jgi:hypothetical protein
MSKKMNSGFVPVGGRFDGFSDLQAQKLVDAYGQPISKTVGHDINNIVNTWLYRYEKEDEPNRHNLQRKCKQLAKAAQKINQTLNEMLKDDPETASLIFPKHILSKGTISKDFKEAIKALQNAPTSAKEIYSDKPMPDKHAKLIKSLVSLFNSNSLTVTVTKYNQSGSYNPSPFVNFIAKLGEIEPRLKIRNRNNNLKSEASFSNWVYRRMP